MRTDMSAGTRALIMPSRGLDGDDLRGAEIFGAVDRAAQLRGVVEADVLGPDAERHVARRDVLAHLRHARPSAPWTTISRAPLRSPLRNVRKFIGGEPMKSATNMVAGRS